MTLFTCAIAGQRRIGRPFLEASIANRKSKVLYDTGADVSCIDEKEFRKIPLHKRPSRNLYSQDRQFLSASGNKLKVKGAYDIQITKRWKQDTESLAKTEEEINNEKTLGIMAEKDGISVQEEKTRILEKQKSLLEKQAELTADIADRVYWSGPEYQLLDDAHAPDGANRLTAAGSAYGLYGGPAGVVRPFGSWNRSRLVVAGDHVEHWLNGRKVVAYSLRGDEWRAKVAASKFAQYPQYGLATTGLIGIQGDHPGTLAIRHLRIRELP